MFVGVTAIIAGIATAKDLRLFKFSIKDEADLKEKWAMYDANGDGQLDVKELSLFIKESGVDMNQNEIACTYMALDKNFDEKITFEELFFWWKTADEKGNTGSMSV
jgi:Ca2+-binding EF-hand superfamily protein